MQKLFDSEIKVMEIVWEREPISAKNISAEASLRFSWNKNTTYTVIKKIEAKGYIKREDPGFICTSVISRDDARRAETKGLVDKLFGGSRKALFSALIEDEALSREEIEDLRRLIDGREGK